MDSKGLTKENFFDELEKLDRLNKLEKQYPKAMAQFQEWINQYKIDNDWKRLFGEDTSLSDAKQAGKWTDRIAPKFHELPSAMQLGIFIQFSFTVDHAIVEGDPLEGIEEILREGFNDVFSTIENDTQDAS